MKYVCDICGYVYDPELGDPDNGVAPGTPWEEVPEDWVCPLCGVGKDQFESGPFPASCDGRAAACLGRRPAISGPSFFRPSCPCVREGRSRPLGGRDRFS